MRRIPDFVCQRDFSTIGDDPGTNWRAAKTLARKIELIWQAKGARVRCHVQPVHHEDGRIHVYEIKSDMINGLPRAYF